MQEISPYGNIFMQAFTYNIMFPPDPTEKEGFYDISVYMEALERYGSIGNLVRQKAVENGNKIWLEFQDGRKFSYSDVDKMSDKIASSLIEHGISKGERIGIFAYNSPEWILSYFSILKSGAIPVTVNTAFIKDPLAYNLDVPGVSVLFLDWRLEEQFLQIADNLKKIRTVVLIGSNNREKFRNKNLAVLTYDEIISNSGNRRIDLDGKWGDPSAMILTSGTTGKSKVVVETNAQFIATAMDMIDAGGITSQSRIYVYLPLFHIMALDLATISSLLGNATMVLVEKLNPVNFWEDISRYGITHFHAVGPIFEILLKQKESEKEKNHGKLVAIAYSSGEIWNMCRERFHIFITGGYGGTESGIPVTSPYSDVIREKNPPGSCGKPAPPFEVAIVDQNDRLVRAGETGEILIRPKLPWVTFKEYYGMERETLNAFRDLWFHTGDLGRYDENGYIYFVDRAKDAIRRRGENISSFEVEQILLKHNGIRDVAVIPVKMESGDEEVMAAIVPLSGQLKAEDVIDYCVENMPAYWIPNYIMFMDSLPKTPTGRTEKYRIRNMDIRGAAKMTEYISKKISERKKGAGS